MGFLFEILLSAFGTVFGGFVFATMWGWFISPTFGLAGLSIVKAIGVILVVRYLTYDSVSLLGYIEKEKGRKLDNFEKKLLTPIVAIVFLVVGYIVNLFM